MTLLVERYKYTKLERVEVNGKRRYLTPGGGKVASVTTILDATKDKTHLIAWKKQALIQWRPNQDLDALQLKLSQSEKSFENNE